MPPPPKNTKPNWVTEESNMDKELTIQDLEAQADALLAAADEMEELLPADMGKSKRKKAEDEAPEKKARRSARSGLALPQGSLTCCKSRPLFM